jgi:hypothetical protein
MTKVDPKQYLIIDEDNMTAGFSRPIILYSGNLDRSYYLFLDKSFILFEDGSVFSINYIYVNEGSAVSEYKKNQYESALKERSYIGTAIDNCGNIDFNIKKEFDENKGDINQGG